MSYQYLIVDIDTGLVKGTNLLGIAKSYQQPNKYTVIDATNQNVLGFDYSADSKGQASPLTTTAIPQASGFQQ